MALQTRLNDLITALGTDYKQFRTWITGSTTGDLTGLNTTNKSSLVGAINEVKATIPGATPAASETVSGIAEIATQAETTTGTDDLRIVTPLKLQQKLSAYTVVSATETVAGIAEIATQAETTTGGDDARIVTPLKLQQKLTATTIPLSYLDTDSALTANSDAKVPTQKAVKAYADNLLDANNAYVYKGVIDASANPNYPAANAGWTYKISVAGKLGGASGVNVEAGDSATCLVDGSTAGNQATVGANWVIVQTNIDGAFVGPASSVADNFVSFAGTTGKVGKDSGISIDTDGAMTANSNTKVPSQAATRTYVASYTYSKAEMGNPETDLVAAYTAAKA